jgi:hypothetical protein
MGAVTVNAFDFLLLALATYRVAAIITEEYGPFGIMHKLRMWLDPKMPRKWSNPGSQELYSFTRCVKCMSVWVALSLFVLLSVIPDAGRLIVSWFAISGAALMLRSYTGVKHD